MPKAFKIILILIIILLILFISGYFLFIKDYLESITIIDRCLKKLREANNEIIFYIPSSVDFSAVLNLKEKIAIIDGVVSHQLKTAEENLQIFKEKHKNEPNVLKGLSELKDNPLNHMLIINISNKFNVFEFINRINKEGVNLNIPLQLSREPTNKELITVLETQKKQLFKKLIKFDIEYIKNKSGILKREAVCQS